MQRRTFIKSASAGTAVMASTPLLWGSSQNWMGANDRIRVGIIGIRGMGQSHIQSFNALENVEVVAICDVDENLFDERKQPTHHQQKGVGDESEGGRHEHLARHGSIEQTYQRHRHASLSVPPGLRSTDCVAGARDRGVFPQLFHSRRFSTAETILCNVR